MFFHQILHFPVFQSNAWFAWNQTDREFAQKIITDVANLFMQPRHPLRDTPSGKDLPRPQLDQLRGFVREGDTVVAHSMDGLARNRDDSPKLHTARRMHRIRERTLTRGPKQAAEVRVLFQCRSDPYDLSLLEFMKP